jgi:hypothetical protein
VPRTLRLDARDGSNGATRGERKIGRRRLRENAARQVLEHLARDAIVIGRVRGTARNIGTVVAIVRVGIDSRALLRHAVMV